jgi:hypothetical protein
MNGKIIAGVLLVVGGAFQVFLLIGGALQGAVLDYYTSFSSAFNMYVTFRVPTIVAFLIAGIFLMIERPGEKAGRLGGVFMVGSGTCIAILIVMIYVQILTDTVVPSSISTIFWILVPACTMTCGILLTMSETSKVKKAGVAFVFYSCLEAVSILIFLLVPDIGDLYILNQLASLSWVGAHAFLFIGAILLIRIDR